MTVTAAIDDMQYNESLAGHTWLGALSNLDLQLVGVDDKLGCDAKAAGSHLLDAGGGGVALLQALQVGEGGRVALFVHIPEMLPPHRILATLA